mgnify:CR=1 FL=1
MKAGGCKELSCLCSPQHMYTVVLHASGAYIRLRWWEQKLLEEWEGVSYWMSVIAKAHHFIYICTCIAISVQGLSIHDSWFKQEEVPPALGMEGRTAARINPRYFWRKIFKLPTFFLRHKKKATRPTTLARSPTQGPSKQESPNRVASILEMWVCVCVKHRERE